MLVRRDSLVPVLSGDHGLDRFFEDFFGTAPFATPAGRRPAVDAWEDEKSYHVEAELPGLTEKDIEISVLDDELRIAGGRESEKEEKTANYHRRERAAGKFSRVLRFPVAVDGDGTEAKFENGVLHVTLPKAAAALPRRIEVKS